jgi:soluble cytochrome b562
MNKQQAKAIVQWVQAMDNTIQDISKGLEELSDVVFKHARMNLDSRQQITNLIIQLGEATDVLDKEEIKKLKEI